MISKTTSGCIRESYQKRQGVNSYKATMSEWVSDCS